MATKKKTIDFEKALSELDRLVTTMESGEMSLEESLKSFEQGVKLTRECQQALQEAEQKVELLLQNSDGLERKAFTDENESKGP